MNDITPTAIIEVQVSPAKQAALRSIERIEKLREEVKTLVEMQNSVMENDDAYCMAVDQRKEVNAKLKEARQNLMAANHELIERQAEIAELRTAIKEAKSEVGYQLGLFQQQTGSSVIESNSGKTYHIVNTYKAKSE